MQAKDHIVGNLAYWFLKTLYATYRVTWTGLEYRRLAEQHHPSGSFCIAIWHEHSFPVVFSHRGQRFAPMASLSKDGDIASLILGKLGFRPVRGSSSRGGKAARSDMEDMISQGWFTALTVDGPRGPRRETKAGIVDVARRTGVLILPLVTVADRAWEFKSWDRFKLPKPFARLSVCYGEPIQVPPQTSGEDFQTMQTKVTHHLSQAEARGLESLAKPL